jgi:hypothetical protein
LKTFPTKNGYFKNNFPFFGSDVDPNFHVDADPDLNPYRHKYDTDPHADLTPYLTHVGKSYFQKYFSHSLPVTCFTFLISVKDVIMLSILDSILKLFHMLGLDTNPDWLNLDQHALDADPDPPK